MTGKRKEKGKIEERKKEREREQGYSLLPNKNQPFPALIQMLIHFKVTCAVTLLATFKE